jgi:hypothetical protein
MRVVLDANQFPIEKRKPFRAGCSLMGHRNGR